MGGRREGWWSVEEAPPVVLGFLLLSLLVVTGSLLALPLNCPFLGIVLDTDAEFALLM